jgi:hypothetical protein
MYCHPTAKLTPRGRASVFELVEALIIGLRATDQEYKFDDDGPPSPRTLPAATAAPSVRCPRLP